MSQFENVKVTKDEFMGVVTVHRPLKMNALNMVTINELRQAISDMDNDRSVRAIVVTGSGEKAFVAGADIAEFAHFGTAQGAELARKGQETLFDYIESLATPVIAAVNGYALGGGLELAMACHFRIAAHNARMGLPEVSLGVIPGYGGTQRLPQLVGKGRAMEMILTAGMIDVERAVEYGLVNHVVSQEQLLPYCKKIAEKIAANSPMAIGHAIKAINAGLRNMDNGYACEIKSFGACFGTADFKEGTTAFLEKRRPDFTGA